MAKVIVQRTWPDGDVLTISIKAESCYPDALAEAKRVALDTYAEALGVTMSQDDE